MSYDFEGSGRLIDGSLNSQYDSEGFSIACWMKLDANAWGTSGTSIMVFVGETLGVVNQSLQLLHTRSTVADRVTARTRDTGDGNCDNTVTVDHDDIWQVFIGVFTADADRDCYAQGTIDAANSTVSKTAGTSLDVVRIGAHGTGGNQTQGLLAEVALYDKALSTSEVDEFWVSAETGNAPNTIATANCIGYWPLAVDQSSHSNEGSDAGGTLTVTSAVWSSDHPTIISGTNTDIIVPMGPIR